MGMVSSREWPRHLINKAPLLLALDWSYRFSFSYITASNTLYSGSIPGSTGLEMQVVKSGPKYMMGDHVFLCLVFRLVIISV